MKDDPESEDLLQQYSANHDHPVNRWCHMFGIPAILLSLPPAVVALFQPTLWPWAIALFVGGWILQFIGHAVEGKPPEFFSNWRFLFIGFRWWLRKISGRQ